MPFLAAKAESDKANLRVNVEAKSGDGYRRERANNADTDRHKRGHGNIPALIESNEEQVGEGPCR